MMSKKWLKAENLLVHEKQQGNKLSFIFEQLKLTIARCICSPDSTKLCSALNIGCSHAFKFLRHFTLWNLLFT